MSKLKFTFVVPVHNGMPYIKECIEGILNQEYQKFDVVILENFSDDGTTEYLSSIKNDKIKIYSSHRLLSIEENWARIVTVPKQEYMVFACADDFHYPNYLSEIIKLIEKYPDASLYRTHFNVIDSDSEITGKSKEMAEQIYQADYLKVLLQQKYTPGVMGYTLRSKDYDTLGGIDCVNKLSYSDDILFMKLIQKSYLATSKEITCCLRNHIGATSSSTESEIAKSAIFYFFDYVFNLKTPELIEIVQKYLQNYLYKVKGVFNKKDFREIKKLYKLYNINKFSKEFIFNEIKRHFGFNVIDNILNVKIFRFRWKIKLFH